MTSTEETDRPERLSVTHHTVGGVRVATLLGEIDHTTKDTLRDALLPGDGTAPRVVADLSGVSFMDSSGINVFVFAHQHLSDRQGRLCIAAPREAVLRVLSLIGVDSVIPCHPTLEDALNA
ncbi:STAS domain-containing protein [Streptomyces sp. NPDC090109]|uniref:STAS domain-containing protein n=1 Tax=unclassified Streptomyces TaxID=2593676 RepID=UPI000EF79E9E|nr:MULTISPECIES: STAS domain-containing protein [unclassified Streptomyces]MZE51749.1 anti-sigma factor antagonist [Streptomyces sp. SID5770]